MAKTGAKAPAKAGAAMAATDTVLSALTASAAAHGERPALRFFDVAELDHDAAAPQTITYAELLRRVIALANAFRTLAGHDAPVVSLLISSTIEGAIALLAAEVAGRANPINHFLDADAIRDSMTDAETEIAVAMGPHPALPVWDKLTAATRGLAGLKATVVTDRIRGPDGAQSVRDLVRAHDAAALAGAQPQPGTPAALFNTAGTTGRPRIVPLTHANLISAAGGLADAWAFAPGTRIVNALPFFHVAGANLLLLGPLMRGAEVLMLSESGLRNPQVLARHWDIVQVCRPTIIGGIPSSLVALLDVPLNGADIGSVRFCATGGAPMPVVAARQFRQQFGVAVHSIYGMTETAGLIAVAPADETPDPETVGRPAPAIAVQVRRLGASATDAPLAHGQNGTICVRGPQVFAGYADPRDAGAPVLTSGAGPGPDGWLATGDMGHLTPDGRLVISGRSKDLIIRSGNNIDPAVIESAAAGLAEIGACAAVAMPDVYAGDVPALFVVPREGRSVSPAAVEAHLRDALADPHSRPVLIEIIAALPLTAVGKISRVELRRMAAEISVRAALGHEDGHGDAVVTASPDGMLEVRLAGFTGPAADQAAERVARLGLRCANASS